MSLDLVVGWQFDVTVVISDPLSLLVQFDNFKRVFKVVEELQGPLVDNVQRHFLVSDSLAK